MKKVLSFLLLIVLLISAVPMSITVNAASKSDLVFTLNNDGESYSVKAKNTSISGELIIPETYNNKPVTHISAHAFEDCGNLTSITIPKSIVKMGEDAFFCCSNLVSVNIFDLSAWCAIDFVDTVTYLSSIQKVYFECFSNPLRNAKNLYLNGELITNLVIPDNVTTIRSYAFMCGNFSSVTIPESVTQIEAGVFKYCYDLTSITLPFVGSGTGATYFGWIFKSKEQDAESAHKSSLPKSITSVTITGAAPIAAGAFRNCKNITSIAFSNKVRHIESGAFDGCIGLKGVYINDMSAWCNIDFPSVDANPLWYAEQLYLNNSLVTKLDIPKNITHIGSFTFSGCTSLSSVTIPECVTSIGAGAFHYCPSLNTVNFDAINCESMESYYPVFSSCSNLTNINIGKNVTKIPEYAFEYCTALTSITIADNVTSIGKYAFYSTPLSTITLGKSLNSIGLSAFGECRELLRVYNRSSNVGLRLDAYQNNVWEGIASGNEFLKEAFWYYESCIGSSTHKYDNACDKDCNVCGATRTPASHKGGTATCKDKAKCSVCGVSYGSLAGHKFGSYVYNNDATSLKDGTKTRTCSVCKKTETITATGTKLKSPFKDVKVGQYYTEPVLWAVSKNITNGTSATTFAPDAECTRGQIVTFLWRAAGSPEPTSTRNPFKDVKSDAYYYKAVLWAVENGITTGTSSTTFSPNAACTRGQVVTFLWRAKGKPAASGSNAFKDVKKGAYYYDAVRWAVKNNITNGMSATSFAPDATCTRGQIVTFLYRAYKENR